MRTIEQWLTEYGSSHRNPTNKLLHWICVPVIVVTVFGFLLLLPSPEWFAAVSPRLNWATLAAVLALMYYTALSPTLALGVVPLLFAMFYLLERASHWPWPLWATCLTGFVIAWIGQFIGHAVEGQRPSFFKDVQFLLLGPLWLLAFVYRGLGLRYTRAAGRTGGAT